MDIEGTNSKIAIEKWGNKSYEIWVSMKINQDLYLEIFLEPNEKSWDWLEAVQIFV